MKKSFWTNLPKPFLCLAPMDGVSDTTFREIITEVARPDVFFTEFTNVEALQSSGCDSQVSRFDYTENQRPIIAQIWGINPENYYKSAKLIKNLGFDGIDINMGCPVKDVVKIGACSALMKNLKLVEEIIKSVVKGAGGLPVSVKTRLAFDSIQTDDWIGFLLQFDLAAIIIHGRTVREMSKVPAHWDEIGKAVELRNRLKKKILIVGNGDINSYKDALEKSKKFGVDGVMIGRGIFQNIAIFDKNNKQLSRDERLKVLLNHARLFVKTWKSSKSFLVLRKFFKIYAQNFDGAKELRIRLMESRSLNEVEKIIKYVQLLNP